jgi:carbonic anhydrase/acetyltransferase-like protein (isoleucine patch superfamily)
MGTMQTHSLQWLFTVTHSRDKEKNMAVYQLNDATPVLHESAWVADSAHVVGRVELGEDTSVWFGTVLRGDMEPIRIGRGSNIQDNSVLHTDHDKPLTIGENVTVGHQVMLHGCTIGDNSLIGIQAVILNGAKIGKNCLVGAGSLVTEGKEFPDGSMILGSPAKAVKQLSPEQIEGLKMSARNYIENSRRYKAGLKKIA